MSSSFTARSFSITAKQYSKKQKAPLRRGFFEIREKIEEKRCAPRGVIMFCAELLCLRGRGKSKKFLFLLRLPPWGSWHDAVVSEGVFIPPHCGFLHPLLCGGLQTPFLMCTFFFEKKVRKKAIREVSRNPLKSSRRSFSATSALPKQRREWSSNLKAFLIVRSFGAFGDGRKRKSFLKPIIEVFCILSFRAWQHKNRDKKSPLFAFHKVCSNQLLKFLLPFVQAPSVQILKHFVALHLTIYRLKKSTECILHSVLWF